MKHIYQNSEIIEVIVSEPQLIGQLKTRTKSRLFCEPKIQYHLNGYSGWFNSKEEALNSCSKYIVNNRFYGNNRAAFTYDVNTETLVQKAYVHVKTTKNDLLTFFDDMNEANQYLKEYKLDSLRKLEYQYISARRN